jgi:TatD DNase family protein
VRIVVLADTHCHLYFDSFQHDLEAVLERARQAGVKRILAPGIDIESSRAAIRLAESHVEIYAAVGCHPTELQNWNPASLLELRSLAQHPKVVAIGEIGLDYYHDRSQLSLQARALEEQLELAAELSLPVVIHLRNTSPEDRQASADLLKILLKWQAELADSESRLAANPGVLHSYSDDLVTARRVFEAGFCIGVTGPVTFKNAATLREVVAGAPLEKILVETDAPFLTPHPYRGKRNEPAYVRFVAEKIGEIRDQPTSSIVERTGRNAGRLFNWRVTH